MNDSQAKKVNIAINIRVADEYSKTTDLQSMTEAVGSYASDLFTSLSLPLQASVDVVSDSSDAAGAGSRVQMDINGHRLQVTPPASSIDPDSGPGGLIERVVYTLYRGRKYAVSDELARALRCEWLPDEEPSAGAASQLRPFVDLLSEALRYGFEITRFKDHADRLAAPDASLQTVHAIVEEVLGSAEKAGGCLFLTTEKYAEYQLFTGSTVTEEKAEQSIPEMLTMMSDGLFYELGLNYSLLVYEAEPLAQGCFRLKINDMQLPVMSSLGQDEILVNDTADRLRLLQVEARPAINPANGAECGIVSSAVRDQQFFEQQGLSTWNADGYMILSASAEIRRAAGAFMTSAELYTDQLGKAFPDLVDCARHRFGMPVMTRILRHLLDEGISIRDLRTILDGLLAVDGVTTADVVETIVFSPNTGIKFPSVDSRPVHELRPEELAECARTVLKRYISHKYTRGGNTLVVYLVEPGIEKMVRASTGPLAQADCDRIIDAVQREVGTSMPSYQMPVILTTMDVRRKLRLLIEAEFPELAVLSYQELSPDMNIQPIARISFED